MQECACETLPNRAEAEVGLQPNAQFSNVCCRASKVDMSCEPCDFSFILFFMVFPTGSHVAVKWHKLQTR